MRICHNGRSETVNRAISDFGSETSFKQAANRFKEHYKYDIGSSAVSRVTITTAHAAQDYVDQTLLEAGSTYGDPSARGGNTKTMVLELDGCDIRTVQATLKEDSTATSPIRRLPKKEKSIRWNEVRIGFARPLESESKIYIGRMDGYPEVVGQLFQAAVFAGLTPETDVIGIADGGNGLKEALEKQFDGMQFILDKQHLQDHFYETADALGLLDIARKEWVTAGIESISHGDVNRVILELETLYDETKEHRLKQLLGYLTRFRHSVAYDMFKEKGYPIGSGEVESAHKSIPQYRMKIAGACWHPHSINPMLSLRILRANGWWEDFWNTRTETILAAA